MLKVIIVEDEDIIRKGLVYTIDWLNMDCVIVDEARDGEEGLEKIIRHEPDVVITDIKMPKMDGIEMLRQARKQVKFKSVILTSYTEFEYAKQAIELKTVEYLIKPVDEEKIKETMQALQKELDVTKNADFARENAQSTSIRVDFDYYMQLDQSETGYVAKAVQRIKDHYADKISIESISEELGVSASYLSRKFREVTSHPFLDLLNSYRVQQAIALLNTGRYRIYEISDMTGFSDYKHFCSVFKKCTSMSPTLFIKKRK